MLGYASVYQTQDGYRNERDNPINRYGIKTHGSHRDSLFTKFMGTATGSRSSITV